MKTGLAVVALLVLAGGWTIHAAVHGERAKGAADAREEYRTAIYVQRAGVRGAGAHEAELAYIDACRACASAAECERDRLVIASGRSSDSYNPCE